MAPDLFSCRLSFVLGSPIRNYLPDDRQVAANVAEMGCNARSRMEHAGAAYCNGKKRPSYFAIIRADFLNRVGPAAHRMCQSIDRIRIDWKYGPVIKESEWNERIGYRSRSQRGSVLARSLE